MRTRLLLLFVAIFIGSFAIPVAASAQYECGDCWNYRDEQNCVNEYCWGEFGFGEECVPPGPSTCYWCEEDGHCDNPHYDSGMMSPTTYQSGINYCNSLEECGDVDLIAAALSYYRNGDLAALWKSVRDSKGTVFINTERGALQATGCKGSVVLHVPLSAEVLALAAEADLTDDESGLLAIPVALLVGLLGVAAVRHETRLG